MGMEVLAWEAVQEKKGADPPETAGSGERERSGPRLLGSGLNREVAVPVWGYTRASSCPSVFHFFFLFLAQTVRPREAKNCLKQTNRAKSPGPPWARWDKRGSRMWFKVCVFVCLQKLMVGKRKILPKKEGRLFFFLFFFLSQKE